jgi:heavy metal sensor kinase
VRRLPIRIRLSAVFIVVMALSLGATGAFVHRRQAADLNDSIDNALRARAQEISALLDSTGGNLEPASPSFAGDAGDVGQVIDEHSRVFDLASGASGQSLLTAGQLATARRGVLKIASDRPPGLHGRARVYARPHAVEEHRFVLVVASSLAQRDATLQSLTGELLLGGAGALLIAALSGFAVASGALRPVEAMRARAALISDLQPGERLTETRTDDEIGRLGQTLNEMLGRLEQVLARERAFVADASHELRTPLTVLRTELELALSQPRSADELRAAMRSACEESEQLARLADDLLLLARSDSSQLSRAREPIDISDMLDHARDQAIDRGHAHGRNIDVLPGAALVVSGDRDALQRAIANLLDNALRHGHGTVTLSAHAGAGGVRIEVTDQGTELDEDFAAHAFERFARAPQARSRPGTGLGLAIVRAIAEAHHGDCGIAPNTPRPGTRAWITLPTVTDRHGPKPAAESRPVHEPNSGAAANSH